MFFFFNDTATTEIYTLSLHDALPISGAATCNGVGENAGNTTNAILCAGSQKFLWIEGAFEGNRARSEEHTSELQSRQYIVCRLLLEKKTQRITLIHQLHLLHLDLPHT